MKKLDPASDGSSTDILKDNIAQLQAIFPEAFTEGKVDFDVLKETLGEYVEDKEERYSFTWHGKANARRIAQTPSSGTLRPCPEESVNWDTTQNLFIEGDNLEVLKLLQKSYHSRVKMIYIDPPYNTGNEFIYPDDFKDNLQTYLRYTGQVGNDGLKLSANSDSSGRFHTNWLNMMYPRLKLAKNLLREDGVLFVSIGENEVTNLRQLCNEIMGEENFITSVIWQKVYAPKSSARHFSEDHDYILVYARSSETWMPNLLPRTKEQDAAYKNFDNDERGLWRPDNLSARNYYSKGTYPIKCPGGRVVEGPPQGRYWRISEERFWELDRDNRIWWGKEGNGIPAPKIFLTEVKQGRVPQTLWKYDEVGHTQVAKKELLGRVEFASSDSVFDTPKPTALIRRMLQLSTNQSTEDIVLDFFAGSATTGDAVLQSNSADNGNRRFILVQIPEPTGAADYASIADIGKHRIRGAIKSIGESTDTAQGDLIDTNVECGCQDLGFKVFKLDASNIKPWDADFDDLDNALLDSVENIKADRSEADVLYELLLKYGLDLAVPIEERKVGGKTIYCIGLGALVVCLDQEITLEVVEAIGLLKDELSPESAMRVVFKDGGFKDDVVKTNALQILKRHGVDDVRSL